jgi:hypothetical protein
MCPKIALLSYPYSSTPGGIVTIILYPRAYPGTPTECADSEILGEYNKVLLPELTQRPIASWTGTNVFACHKTQWAVTAILTIYV